MSRCVAYGKACSGFIAASGIELEGHEHAVRIRHVLVERPARLEAECRVEPARRLEKREGAGLQAETPVAAPPRFREQVPQQCGRDAPAAVRAGRAHRLDLA